MGFPYDTSLMFFWEFYSMNMPIFVRSPASKQPFSSAEVPFQLWHWGIFGAGLVNQCQRHAKVSTPGRIWSNPGSSLKALVLLLMHLESLERWGEADSGGGAAALLALLRRLWAAGCRAIHLLVQVYRLGDVPSRAVFQALRQLLVELWQRSIGELMEQLLKIDLEAVSSAMKLFNEVERLKSL